MFFFWSSVGFASADCICFLLYLILYLVLFFFFFQAEDGIRDTSVTGVQTCALPIWSLLKCWGDERFAAVLRSQATNVQNRVLQQLCYETEDDPRVRSLYPRTFEGAAGKTSTLRSEERRVGKGEKYQRWRPA